MHYKHQYIRNVDSSYSLVSPWRQRSLMFSWSFFPFRYCSSLYPKFERYSTCNWCLSDDGVESAAQESTMDQDRSLSFSSNSTGRGPTVKLHGGASSQHLKKVLNKPVKKQQTHAHERLLLPALTKTSRLDLPLPSLRKQKQAFRCRARKFKLLEEVLT